MTTRPERDILNDIRLAHGHGDVRLFRQQSGEFWAGRAQVLRDGSVLIRNPTRVHVGFDGLSDLGGWRSVEITPEMVGQRVAVYVALEVKAVTGRVRPAQQQFVDTVRAAGGLAGIVRSAEDAGAVLEGVDTGLTLCSTTAAGAVPVKRSRK